MEQKQLQLQPRLALLAALVPPAAAWRMLARITAICRYTCSSRAASPAPSPPTSALSPWSTPAAQRGSTTSPAWSCVCVTALPPFIPTRWTRSPSPGMGGETIIHILENAPWTKDGSHELLLQP